MVAVGKMSCLKMVLSHNGRCRKNVMSQNGHVSKWTCLIMVAVGKMSCLKMVMSHNDHLSTLTLLQVQIVAKKMFLKRQMVVNEFFIKFLLLKSSHSQVKNSAN